MSAPAFDTDLLIVLDEARARGPLSDDQTQLYAGLWLRRIAAGDEGPIDLLGLAERIAGASCWLTPRGRPDVKRALCAIERAADAEAHRADLVAAIRHRYAPERAA